MGRRQGICAALVALAAANTLSASVIRTPQMEFRHLYALNHNGRVVVQNLYGDVSITAWDRDAVLVEAVKSSADARRLEEARIVVEPTADSLTIRTLYAGFDAEYPASVEYRITVPRGANLESVALTNGALSLSGLSGPVKASAVNGGIRASKLGGQAELSTVNGQLEADFERTSSAHPIRLSSVNGPIHLTIPPGSNAGVEAHNLSGGIASDVGCVARTSAGHRLIVRGNGAQIRLQNVNGGISIRSAARPCT